MKAATRNKILKEDFSKCIVKGGKVDYWIHKEVDVYAFVPKKNKTPNEIIFVRRPSLVPLGQVINYGVKFTYNTEEELMTLIISICKEQ